MIFALAPSSNAGSKIVASPVLIEVGKSQPVTNWGGRLAWTGVMLLLIAGLYLLMWRGWRRRAARQSDLPPLPQTSPDGAGEPLRETLIGRYFGTTAAGDWLDRIVARGLGTRSPVELTLTTAGLVVARPGAASFLIPAAALRGARTDRGIAGKVVVEGGLLVVTWVHGDRLLDSGFRSHHPEEHPGWVEAIERLTDSGSAHQHEGSHS